MTLTLGSLFAGIGGFDLGFERAGFRTVWQCEIDKAAQGVLRRHFPTAALHSDVRQVGAHNLDPVDVVTFGSPCQDLSVAGKRAGLAGERSGLFHEAARVIRELRERYGKPDFAIWENVPGAFSSNGGADFAAVVQAMVDLGARDVCWRVVDSRYFGVAQRRRRVFLVADFGGERAEQILFEPESLLGDSKKGGAKRKEAARGAGAGVARRGGEWPADVSATLNAAFGAKMGLEDQHALNGASMFVPAQPVAFAQNSRDEVRLQGGDGQIVGALNAESGMHQTTYVAQAVTLDSVAGPLDASYYKGQGSRQGGEREFVAQAVAPAQPIAFHPTQDPISSEDGVSHTMSSGNRQGCGTGAVAVGFDATGSTADAMVEQHPVLRGVKGGNASHHTGVAVCATGERTHAAQAFDRYNSATSPLSPTLPAGEKAGGFNHVMAYSPAMQVRRLTPVECERLQGFPEVQESVMLSVWLEQENTHARVGMWCPKKLNNAWLAAGAGLPPTALSADRSSCESLVESRQLALPLVRINFAQDSVQILSQGNESLSVVCAREKDLSLQSISQGFSALMLARMRQDAEKETRNGKEVLQTKEELSFHRENGSWRVVPYGQGITQLVEDAKKESEKAQTLMFTTSRHGPNIPTSNSPWTTLFCFVLNAIDGCIQKETQSRSFLVEVRRTTNWTSEATAPDGTIKQQADGPRYKQLGNAVTVNVAEWIARRLAATLHP